MREREREKERSEKGRERETKFGTGYFSHKHEMSFHANLSY